MELLNLIWGFVKSFALAETKAIPSVIKIAEGIVRMLSLLLPYSDMYPPLAQVKDNQTFDFIILGGGTAGCVLANRLTEGNWSVLLVEAGGLPPASVSVPSLFFLLNDSTVTWDHYSTEFEDTCQCVKQNKVRYPMGKMLGGSGSKGFTFYVRGEPVLYDNWATMLDDDSWNSTNVLKYFKKSERLDNLEIYESNTKNLHSYNGSLGITRPSWTATDTYFQALQEAGLDYLIDHNGINQIGCAKLCLSIADRTRQSPEYNYLRPMRNRSNLYLSYNTLATQVLFNDDNEAVGARLRLSNGTEIQVLANKEVILSTGVFGSPQLLMLSGVGPESHLTELGIEVVYNSSQVGQNLKDRPFAPVLISGTSGMSTVMQNMETFTNLNTFALPSILSTTSLNTSQSCSDCQIFSFVVPAGSPMATLICTLVNRLEDEYCSAVAEASMKGEIFLNYITITDPKSSGEVKLKSSNITDDLIIYPKYFNNTDDLDKLVNCILDYLKVLNTTTLQELNSEVYDLRVSECEDYDFLSREYWTCFIKTTSVSHLHPSGTCSIGPEDTGVVDAKLKVYGVSNLRVVDASVIPTGMETYAPVIMIAEKAADLIKEEYGVE